jgi:hypothetical protein
MIIYQREFSVMPVMFSNRRVTHLRDLDARDGFCNIQKHCMMIYERGRVPTKVRNSFGGVRDGSDGVRYGSDGVSKSFGVTAN